MTSRTLSRPEIKPGHQISIDGRTGCVYERHSTLARILWDDTGQLSSLTDVTEATIVGESHAWWDDAVIQVRRQAWDAVVAGTDPLSRWHQARYEANSPRQPKHGDWYESR